MARAKSSPLAVKAERLKLPVAKNPVFEVLGDGVGVGYRRCDGAGTWVARRSDGKGGKFVRRLGVADDYADADGERVLSWAQAQAAALKFDPIKEAADALAEAERAKAEADKPPPLTVAKALDRYEDDLKTRGGDLGNVQRLRIHVSRYLLDRAVTEITVSDLKEWRDKLVKTLAPATVNRTANCFKAALNLAADGDDSILTRNAWEKGLKALPDAEEARNIILPDAEVKKVIQAAYQQGDELGLLVEVAAVTGSRYGQIAALTVGDLLSDHNEPRLMMPSSKKGHGQKKVLRRAIPIAPALAKKLEQAAGNRPATAPLLMKPPRPQTNEEKKTGIQPQPDAWRKSDHYRPFNRAVAAAFKPADNDTSENDEPAVDKNDEASDDAITIYALRHSSIVRQILAGVPVRVVAVLHDTSVAMIEKNYSRYLSEHTDTIARAAMLDISAPEGGNVTRLPRRRVR